MCGHSPSCITTRAMNCCQPLRFTACGTGTGTAFVRSLCPASWAERLINLLSWCIAIAQMTQEGSVASCVSWQHILLLRIFDLLTRSLVCANDCFLLIENGQRNTQSPATLELKLSPLQFKLRADICTPLQIQIFRDGASGVGTGGATGHSRGHLAPGAAQAGHARPRLLLQPRPPPPLRGLPAPRRFLCALAPQMQQISYMVSSSEIYASAAHSNVFHADAHQPRALSWVHGNSE